MFFDGGMKIGSKIQRCCCDVRGTLKFLFTQIFNLYTGQAKHIITYYRLGCTQAHQGWFVMFPSSLMGSGKLLPNKELSSADRGYKTSAVVLASGTNL